MKAAYFPDTNLNMLVFEEEYWLEYIDALSGMPLRWWGRNGRRAEYSNDVVNYTVDR
jgi:hypothetical protein